MNNHSVPVQNYVTPFKYQSVIQNAQVVPGNFQLLPNSFPQNGFSNYSNFGSGNPYQEINNYRPAAIISSAFTSTTSPHISSDSPTVSTAHDTLIFDHGSTDSRAEIIDVSVGHGPVLSNVASNFVSAPTVVTSNTTSTTRMSTHVNKSLKKGVHSPTPHNDNNILNTCLAFFRSLMFRRDEKYIIDMTVQHFSLDELKAARELLYRSSGTSKYSYRGLNDPATAHQRACHCAASILHKFHEIEKAQAMPKIVCAAEDLYRLINMNVNSTSMEDRMSALEKEMREIKSLKSSINFPPLPSSGASYSDMSRRQNLLNEMNQQFSPGVRSRSNSESIKRNRSDDNEPHNPLKKKKTFWGRNDASHSDLAGPDLHEVFLFNYRLETVEDKIKTHFEEHGVKVAHIKRISHPEHYVKNFLMKITNKDDFDKIIKVLPPRTGARWFVHDSNRPQETSFFNKNMIVLQDKTQITPVRPSTLQNQFTASIFSPARSQYNSKPSTPNTVVSSSSVMVTTQVSAPAYVPTVSVSNRFSALDTPQFEVGGPLSLQSEMIVNEESEVNHTSTNNP